MQITRGSDYAIRGVIALAKCNPKDYIMSARIAEQENLPVKFFAKLFRLLALAGVLKSTRGARGGFSLARSPDQITVWDVITSVEGKININVCVNNFDICENQTTCPMADVWTQAQNAVENIFRTITIAMLIEKESRIS